jgi:hypothetical protein
LGQEYKAAGSKEIDVTITTDPVSPKLNQSQATQAMMDRITGLRAVSTAEALRVLRAAFPDMPLAARVTALEAMRRSDAT